MRAMRLRRWSAALASLVLVGLTAQCGGGVTHDETVKFGEGYAVTHVPGNHSRVGVVVLHSYLRGASELVHQGWSVLADKENFVAIYPYRDNSWNAGMCCGTGSKTKRDDVSWLTSVIATLKAKYGLDRIYLAGNSNGGMMAERLVAERPWISDRIAVWGSSPEMRTSGRWTGRAALFGGENDKTVPWKGGKSSIGGVNVTIRAAGATSNWLIGANLTYIRVPDVAHNPGPEWPAMAWAQLSR
jgi:poly(3-hydroxybutyrate) depolymerase